MNYEDTVESKRYLKFFYKEVGAVLGHSGQIERIAVDNTGEHVFSGGSDGMIKIWDIETGFLVHTCIAHRILINDLCFSKDGKLFVSCDYNGIINIWNLKTFELCFTIRLYAGIAFSEFFENKDNKDAYSLVVILCNGLVKFYAFDHSGILSEKENDFTIDEPYKAICITDGGRLLLRAGYWPYIILLDTWNFDKCIIFETNNLHVQTICAAKDRLKFAAGCGDWVIQWTYYSEGISSMGNFNRSSKILPGYWRRNIFKIDVENEVIIDNMCYLKNQYLVCVCTDFKIRIYSERILRFTIPITEMGTLCAHPFENIFAFYGQFLSFYNLDKLISREKINFSINDCQFSNDGQHFLIGDELGNVRNFSISRKLYILKEQFFLSDFEHFTNDTDILYRECKNDYTLDSNRLKNTNWKLPLFYTQSINDKKNVIIEEASLMHFTSKYLDKTKYKRKYCDFTVDSSSMPSCTNDSEDNQNSDNCSSSENLEFSSKSDESTEEDFIVCRRYTSNNAPIQSESRPTVTLRRNYVEANYEKPKKKIRLRRNDNNEDQGLEFVHYQRRQSKRRKKNREREYKSSSSSDSRGSKTESPPNIKVKLRRHMSSDT